MVDPPDLQVVVVDEPDDEVVVIRVGEPPPLETAVVAVVDVPSVGDGPARYVHHQATPSATWIVEHGLGRRPVAWSLYNADDVECVEYAVSHPEVNRCVVRMDVPTAGSLYLI